MAKRVLHFEYVLSTQLAKIMNTLKCDQFLFLILYQINYSLNFEEILVDMYDVSRYYHQYMKKKLPICYIIFLKESKGSMHDHPLVRLDQQPEQNLSCFIQLFKRAITTAELLSLTIQKRGSPQNALKTACEIIGQLSQLSEQHLSRNTQSINPITFSRFLYRLIEIIANCKIKYQYTVSCFHDESLQKFLREIEAVVRSCQLDSKNSFVSIIRLAKLVLLKFCNKITAIFDSGYKQQNNQSEDFKKLSDKLKEQFSKAKQIQKIKTPRVFFLIAASESDRPLSHNTVQEKESHTFLSSHSFSEMRKRFEKYAGMDLDFVYFRSSYFDAKSHYDTFYQDFLSRNNSCQTSIGAFSEEFQGHSKRKEARALRKNKVEKTIFKSCIKSIHKAQLLATNTPSEKQDDRGGVSMSMTTTKIKNHLDDCRSQFKEKEAKQISQSERIRKKYFQSNHQYLNTGLVYKNVGTIAQENLNQEHHKLLLRLRTEADKRKGKKDASSSIQPLQISSKREGVMKGYHTSTGGKASLKTKYFQLTCLPQVMKENSLRNRIGFNQKFYIKHGNQSKSRNWLDRRVER